MSLAALFQSGAGGIPVPDRPLAFGPGFALPRSPNTHLLAPPGAGLPAHAELPEWPTDPATLWAALQQVAAAEPRTTLLAAWPESMQAQWVVRSALMNYPDIVVGEVRPGAAGAGAGLILYSRSLLGWSDLGANAARLGRWRAALEARLPRR